MKRLVIACVLLLSVFNSVSACSVTPVCGWGGYFTFRGDPGYSTWAHVQTTDANGIPNGVFDSLYNFPLGTLQSFVIPNSGTVHLKVTWEENNIVNFATSTNNSCAPLAVKSSMVYLDKEVDGYVMVHLNIEGEDAIKNYRIKLTKNGVSEYRLIFFPESLRKGKYQFKIKL